MKMHDAKMKTLDDIIGMMDGHIFGSRMKKPAAPEAPAPEAMSAPEAPAPEADDLDPESAKRLMEMYQSPE